MHNKILTAAALLVLPLGALAAGADYSYGQLDYISSSGKVVLEEFDSEADYDGFGVELSHALGESGYVFGELKLAETDDFEVGGTPVDDTAFDFNRYSLGLGKHVGNEVVHLYGALSYERLSIEHETGHGFGLTAGMRITHQAAGAGYDRVEINPQVKYVDYGDIDDVNVGMGSGTDIGDVNGFEYGLRVLVYVTQHAALSLDYMETSLNADFEGISSANSPDFDMENELAVGLRYHF